MHATKPPQTECSLHDIAQQILQDVFKKHSIDKPIPVEALVRCKMQDNLEFTQWLKRFWDANWPGLEYDAPGRRGGQGGSM